MYAGRVVSFFVVKPASSGQWVQKRVQIRGHPVVVGGRGGVWDKEKDFSPEGRFYGALRRQKLLHYVSNW